MKLNNIHVKILNLLFNSFNDLIDKRCYPTAIFDIIPKSAII